MSVKTITTKHLMDIERLKQLSGVIKPANSASMTPYGNERRADSNEGSNISITGNEKGKIQNEKGIEPGTPEWFQLWFSLPYLTGEKPVGKG